MSDVKAGAAYVLIEARDKLSGALGAASKKLDAFGQSVAGIGAKMAGAGLAIGAPLILAVEQFAKLGEELLMMSLRTGVTVENLSGLRYAAEQSGASADDLAAGFRFLNKNLFSAAKGSKETRDSFEELGLSVHQLATMSADERFLAVAEAISKIQDPTIRAGRAMAVLGKGALSLMPMMLEGKAGIAALRAEAERLGIIMSTEDASAAEALGDAFESLGKTVRGVAMQVGASLAPALTSILTTIAPMVKLVGDWVKANRGIIIGVAILAAGLVAAGTALVLFGGAAIAIGAALSAMKVAFLAMASPIGLTAAAVVGLGFAIFRFTKSGGAAIDWLANRFGYLLSVVSQVWAGISDAMAGGDLTLAGQIATKGMEIVWTDFKSWIIGIWHDISDAIANTWLETVTGFSLALAHGLSGMTSLLHTFATAARVVWTSVATWATKTWAQIGNAASRFWADFELGADALAIMVAQETGEIDTEEAGRQMLEAVDRNKGAKKSADDGMAATIKAADDKAAAEMAATLATFKKNEEELAAKLAQDKAAILATGNAEAEARNQANVAAKAGKTAEMAILRAELAESIAAARDAAAGVLAKTDPKKAGLGELPDMLSGLDETKPKFGGTFSAAMAGRLAGGGNGNPQERAAKAGEKALDKLDTLIREVRLIPVVKFD